MTKDRRVGRKLVLLFEHHFDLIIETSYETGGALDIAKEASIISTLSTLVMMTLEMYNLIAIGEYCSILG